ncbi:MAG: tripartite tricarboxylate transporter TctB family protein [Paracoccaceae bacterium]
MRIAELVTAIVLAVLSIYMMWKSGQPAWEGEAAFQNIWFEEGEGPGSGFWPFWLSGAMLLCCVWIVVNWLRRASPPSRSEERYLDAYGLLMLLKVGGGVTVFIGLVHVIGMYAATALFLFYYLYFLGRHSVVTTIAVAIGIPVALFFFFDIAMRKIMPTGYLEPLFIPLYEIFL